MKQILRFLAAVFLFLPPIANSAVFSRSARGTSAAPFLKLGAGARAAAMGDAHAAAVSDANAVYWNPSALTRIKGKSATVMHAAYIESSFFDYAAFAQKLGNGRAWGVGIQYVSAGKITERDSAGNDVGTFSPNDLTVSLSYAWKLRGIALGLTAKYIRTTILETAQTSAADLGILSPPLWNNRLHLSLGAMNLGGKLKFEGEPEKLPVMLKTAGALKLTDRISASMDVVFPNDDSPYVGTGTEYLLYHTPDWDFTGRAGVNTRAIGDIDGLAHISIGFGVRHNNTFVDYAFVPLGSLALTHRISLTFKL